MYFIAEVSSNHNRDIERAIRFVDCAADAGCSAVKFQLFRVEKLFAPEILSKSDEHRRRKQWELPLEFIPRLADHTHNRGMQFCCTPFDLEAVEALEPWVDFYKVASYELLWDGLLQKCAESGKPLVLSTGMATVDEIAHAVEVVTRSGGSDRLTLLHCVSGYPTPVDEANLAAIETLRNRFGCPVGWSDHTVSRAVIHRAVNHWQAAMVEFHLDLDREGEEYAGGHCWLPEQIGNVIKEIKLGTTADGDGEKVPLPSELADREWRADPADGLRPLITIRERWEPPQVDAGGR